MSALSVTHFCRYSKTHCKKLVTRVESHAGSVSLLESCIIATKEFTICATVMFSRSHTGGSSLIDKDADTAPPPPPSVQRPLTWLSHRLEAEGRSLESDSPNHVSVKQSRLTSLNSCAYRRQFHVRQACSVETA